jgi:hypothetical protein
VPVVALLGVWQVANAAGFAWQAVAETIVPSQRGAA